MSTDTKTREIEVKLIRLDGETQPRTAIDEVVVGEYAAAYALGIKMPPVVVFFDDADYWLADGFHRYLGASKVGPKILAEVRKGTVEEARWFSCSANQTHGLRRSNADKAKAVKAAIEHPKAEMMSDREIGRHVGADPKTVARYRNELVASEEIPQIDQRTVKRGDQEYEQNTSNIGKQKPEPAAALELGEETEVVDVPREEEDSRKDAKTQREETEERESVPLPPASEVCRNCGGVEFDEDNDCVKCLEPVELDDAKLAETRQPSEPVDAVWEKIKRSVLAYVEANQVSGMARLENLIEEVREADFWQNPPR